MYFEPKPAKMYGCFVEMDFTGIVWNENICLSSYPKPTHLIIVLRSAFDKRWVSEHSLCEEKGVVVNGEVENTEFLTFQVGDLDYKHEIGNPKCEQGWCNGGESYPKKCECGGLVHADFGDENSDCDYWLYRACDKCGVKANE